jgi:hypothetical protein
MRLACLLICVAPAWALDAGAAKRTITPDLKLHFPVYIPGFGRNRVATAVHDDLYARCMAFRAGTRPLVLCGVDSIGLFFDDVKRIRAKVPGANVVVSSTHDHEAVDTMGMWGPAEGKTGINEAYNSLVIDRTAEAAQAAVAALQPASLKAAKIHTPELDTFIDDGRPPVRHDSEIVGIVAVARNGSVIGTLVIWANHPVALSS